MRLEGLYFEIDRWENCRPTTGKQRAVLRTAADAQRWADGTSPRPAGASCDVVTGWLPRMTTLSQGSGRHP